MLGLIADHVLVHTIEQWAIVTGVFLAGAGYALGQWRRGREDHVQAALGIATDELGVLKSARDRMGGELHEARERIAALEGTVEQLRRENAALRELVMLDTIPPALVKALDERSAAAAIQAGEVAERAHAETRARILAELADAEARLTALFGRREGAA